MFSIARSSELNSSPTTQYTQVAQSANFLNNSPTYSFYNTFYSVNHLIIPISCHVSNFPSFRVAAVAAGDSKARLAYSGLHSPTYSLPPAYGQSHGTHQDQKPTLANLHLLPSTSHAQALERIASTALDSRFVLLTREQEAGWR